MNVPPPPINVLVTSLQGLLIAVSDTEDPASKNIVHRTTRIVHVLGLPRSSTQNNGQFNRRKKRQDTKFFSKPCLCEHRLAFIRNPPGNQFSKQSFQVWVQSGNKPTRDETE